MKIVIVEDEEVHGRRLEQYILEWGRRSRIPVSVKICDNAEIFFFYWEDESFDVVFADIQMPGMNGMDMVKKLRLQGFQVPVVFTTGIEDYMQEGYEVEALHYLLKPLSKEKVAACLDKVLEKHEAVGFLTVDTARGVQKIDIAAIDYCEAVGHRIQIVLAGGGRICSTDSLSDLAGKLSGRGFLKCHRSYLCKVDNMNRIVEDMVFFDDGEGAPVSRLTTTIVYGTMNMYMMVEI